MESWEMESFDEELPEELLWIENNKQEVNKERRVFWSSLNLLKKVCFLTSLCLVF